MWTVRGPMVESVRSERALLGASACAVGWLLGPGVGVVNALLGPAAGESRSLNWLEQAADAPQDALVRMATALGLVLAVRLAAALLLVLVSWIPGPTAVGAARLGRWLAPPLARRFVEVLVGVSLTSGTGIALTAPALAATHPAAAVVPAPVLAPPEAMLQTWPDLGRPGADVPSTSLPGPTRTSERAWPDLGRPGTDEPTSPAPPATGSPRQPSDRPSHRRRPTHRPPEPSARTARPVAPAAAGPATSTTVVVAPGDCLWTLAERDLEAPGGVTPSPSDVAAATEKWWQANRAAIGGDPNRLMPGQRLRSPNSPPR